MTTDILSIFAADNPFLHVIHLATTTSPEYSRDFYRGMFVLGVTVVLILVLFQPFGTAAFQHTAKYVFLAGYGLAIVVAAIIYYETVSRMAPRWLDHRPWTLGRRSGSCCHW